MSEPKLQTLEPRTSIGAALRRAFLTQHNVEPLIADLAELEVRTLAQLSLVRWERSKKKNNPWVKLPDATLTVFRTKEKVDGIERWGWKGCITRSAKEGPIFGELLHEDVESAKSALLLKYISLGGRLEN